MADWAADIKKYADADDAVVAEILKTYRLVLGKRDSAYVAMSDATEVATVRERFLKKKLGLTEDDATLDAAIAEVGAHEGGPHQEPCDRLLPPRGEVREAGRLRLSP